MTDELPAGPSGQPGDEVDYAERFTCKTCGHPGGSGFGLKRHYKEFPDHQPEGGPKRVRKAHQDSKPKSTFSGKSLRKDIGEMVATIGITWSLIDPVPGTVLTIQADSIAEHLDEVAKAHPAVYNALTKTMQVSAYGQLVFALTPVLGAFVAVHAPSETPLQAGGEMLLDKAFEGYENADKRALAAAIERHRERQARKAKEREEAAQEAGEDAMAQVYQEEVGA